jgi:NADH-quinone oxidoreductase subunit E
VPISDATREEAQRLVKRYPVARSALLPLLHLVQSDEGYVSEDGIALCAELLGLTKAEVGAVSTFYTMYKREPFGDYLLSVCTNPTCKIAGGDEIYRSYVESCGGEIDREGGVMVEHAECLGICDAAPVVQVNYEMFGPVTRDEAMGLLDKARAGDPPVSNWSGEKPPTFAQVQRELSGIEDGVDEQLIEAAALQTQAAVPPAYRSGETDIPVTHPGGDPHGHGGETFRESAGLALSPVEEKGPGPKGELGPEERAEAAEVAEDVGGEAEELAAAAAGEQPADPTPPAEDQPAVDEMEGGTSPEADTEPATGSEPLEGDEADPERTQHPDETDPDADGDRTRGEEA